MLIMTFATKSLSSVSVGLTRAATTGVAAVMSVAKAVANRRQVLRLSELDDRALKDIGLVRSDVEGALATSWLNDPSTQLASHAGGLMDRRKAELRQGALVDEVQRHELIQRASVSGHLVKAQAGRTTPSLAAQTSVACCA